jgi:uncharacterized membrane protein YozB (DUF420 family)
MLVWPALNASLNAASAVALMAGYAAIRRRRIQLHKTCMLTATAVSVAFLVSYVLYHYGHGSTKFEGEGLIRTVYFTILVSHTILAVANVPLIMMTLWRAFRDERERHRRLARITLPIWLYVSVTGVIVYWMLYQLG